MGAGAAGLGGAQSQRTGTAAAPLAAGGVAASQPEAIGTVTHYYDRAGAAVVKLDSGVLHVGDTIHVRGHTTDFYQRVDRIERDHVAVETARAGEEVAVAVSQRVREHDAVFRLRRG